MKYYSISEIKNELCNHLITSDKMVFKNSIKSIEEQRNRFYSILVQLEEALENRFKQKSFTYNRFDGMIAEVSENLINNYDYIKKIMDTFDDSEYKRLQAFHLAIPKELQYQKLEMYEDTINKVTDCITENEKLIIQIEGITPEIIELNDRTEEMSGSSRKIEELVEQLKFYKQ